MILRKIKHKFLRINNWVTSRILGECGYCSSPVYVVSRTGQYVCTGCKKRS